LYFAACSFEQIVNSELSSVAEMAGLAGDLRGGAASSSKSKTEFARVRIRNLHDKVCNERVRDGDGDATLFFAVQESDVMWWTAPAPGIEVP
jgi:hypothetical protein